jgi:hypothetical protein
MHIGFKVFGFSISRSLEIKVWRNRSFKSFKILGVSRFPGLHESRVQGLQVSRF